MSTSCKINIIEEWKTEDGVKTIVVSIYRHSDGYPEGVLSDIKVFMDNYHDPNGSIHGVDYWLMNFAFYCKLSNIFTGISLNSTFTNWFEYGYGICSESCKHGDLEYEYWIDLKKGKIKIMKFDWKKNKWKKEFEGTLKKAFEKYAKSNGYHLYKESFRIMDFVNKKEILKIFGGK